MSPPPGGNTPDALTPSQRKALALQRIDASRSQLIVHLYPQPEVRHRVDTDPATAPPPSSDSVSRWMARAQRNGLVEATWRMARALGRRWWTRQPWHASAELVASTLAHEAKPLVRRHPWVSVAAGAAAGAVAMAAVPWLLRSLRRQAQPWRDEFGKLLWQQLAQAPVQLAIAGALTAWLTDFSRRSSQDHQPDAASGEPAPTVSAAPAPPVP